MKKTLYWALLLAALLALLTGAALAEPWAGSGTESDPWLITSAADLVALREYVAAGENATQGSISSRRRISASARTAGRAKATGRPSAPMIQGNTFLALSTAMGTRFPACIFKMVANTPLCSFSFRRERLSKT